MTNKVILEGLTSNECMDIVRELKEQGYVQGQHFDFEFVPTESDYITGHFKVLKHTNFTFYVDSLSTWFKLKYG